MYTIVASQFHPTEVLVFFKLTFLDIACFAKSFLKLDFQVFFYKTYRNISWKKLKS